MAVIDLHEAIVSGTAAGVTATASATTAPTSSTDGFGTGPYPRVRTLILYAGTVSSINVRIWFRDRATGVWYRGADTDAFDALAPGGASAVAESRDWETGRNQEIFFQIVAIAGGGTAAIRLQPIDTGARW